MKELKHNALAALPKLIIGQGLEGIGLGSGGHGGEPIPSNHLSLPCGLTLPLRGRDIFRERSAGLALRGFGGSSPGGFFVGTLPEALYKGLEHRWRVNRISADLTPYTSEVCMPDGTRIPQGMRDSSRIQYQEVNSTESVRTHSYILHCSEVG